MRIAFLSFEYPPGISSGIGAYTYLAARSLVQAGHEVTVICGKVPGQSLDEELYPGLRITRLEWEPGGKLGNLSPTRRNLKKIARTVRELHRERPFDIIEGPDYQIEAYQLLHEGCDCPVITKLHTAGDLIWELTARQVRSRLWRLAAYYLAVYPRQRLLQQLLARSTRIHAPSLAIARLAAQRYGLDCAKIDHVPHHFIPSLAQNPVTARQPLTVLFVGRLDVIKGVHLFAKIIPLVLAKFPQARFVFLGKDGNYGAQPSMKNWLGSQLGAASSSCDFLGWVPPDRVQHFLRQAAVCVLPSLWESFSYVCLEAMAAGGVVVGSMQGGMAEMIEDGVSGFLGDPAAPPSFAAKVILALSDQKLRQSLGRAAQQTVWERYRPEVIIPRQLAAYQQAIELWRQSPKT